MTLANTDQEANFESLDNFKAFHQKKRNVPLIAVG